MPRLASFLVFFAIATSLVAAVHYFIWARLVRDPGFSPPVARALTIAVIALFASVPLSFFVARFFENPLGRAFTAAAFVWLGMVFIFLVVLGALELVRVAALLAMQQTSAGAEDPQRRQFLFRLLAGAAALIAGGMSAAALKSGLSRVLAREVHVRLERLPSELDGTVIAQLSDVHIGPTLRREFLESVVDRTNALEPDLVVITGDLVDGSVEALREQVAPLARLKSRYGVFFVTGNHEYYSGVDEWCAELPRLGIRVLRNERVAIGAPDASFDLAGIDDHQARQFGNGHGPDLQRALAGRDPTRELVLLAHQPRAVLEAMNHGVGLQLSGHTHGGQIWPWNFMVRLQQPVVSGLARFGSTLVYVSNGTGYWGPPMRLRAPAEITKIVLRAPREAVA